MTDQAQPRLFLCDPDLRSLEGHHFLTTARLAEEAVAQGWAVSIVASREAPRSLDIAGIPFHRAFTASIYQTPVMVRSLRFGGAASWIDQHSDDLARLADLFSLTDRDNLFFHTSTGHQLAGWTDFLLATPPARRPRLHALFRLDPRTEGWSCDFDAVRRGLTMLEGAAAADRIRLYAETGPLAEIYQAETGRPVRASHHFPTASVERIPRTGDEIRVTYLGEAREEKGFDALGGLEVQALRSLGARLVAQTYAKPSNLSPAVERALSHVDDLVRAGVGEGLGAVTQSDYEALLAAADVVIVSHRAPQYAARGSGVFVDAACAGAPLVIQSGTWMADQARSLGLTAFFFDGADGIAAAVAKAAAHVRRGQAAPTAALKATRALFSVSRAIELLTETSDSPAASTRPLALHTAPWWLKQGSTKVFEAQRQALSELGYAVACVHLTPFPLDKPVDGRGYQWFCAEARSAFGSHDWTVFCDPEAIRREEGVAEAIVGQAASWTAERLAASCYEVPGHLRACAQATRPDAVVLNYVHNVPVLRALGLDPAQAVIETHDLRSLQHASTIGAVEPGLDMDAELAHLLEAPALVFINESEHQDCVARGYVGQAVTLLPCTPLAAEGVLDLGELPDSEVEAQQVLTRFRRLQARVGADAMGGAAAAAVFAAARRQQLGLGRYGVFVGSDHHWNRISLSWMYEEVFVPQLRPAGLQLILVGGCGAWFEETYGRQPDVIVTGRVADPSFVYDAPFTILLPVLGGTGFPIKTLEAIQSGRPFVGTREAFRGFEAFQALAVEPAEFGRAVLAGTAAPAIESPLLDWGNYKRSWAELLGVPEPRRKTVAATAPKEHLGRRLRRRGANGEACEYAVGFRQVEDERGVSLTSAGAYSAMGLRHAACPHVLQLQNMTPQVQRISVFSSSGAAAELALEPGLSEFEVALPGQPNLIHYEFIAHTAATDEATLVGPILPWPRGPQ